MTHKISIKHRYTDAVLFEFEATDEQQASGLATRVALEAAVRGGANLGGAYLGDAYLGGADLRGADLGGANLGGANLGGVYLRGADLGGANLRGDIKLIGGRPLLQIGPIGSRSDTLLVFVTDAGLRIRAGCFFGSRDEFASAVEKEHGDNAHGREYRAALVLIDAHAAEWTPATVPAAEAAQEAA